jgi:mobilome CxxCx(11)CxxC protein
MSVGAQVDPRFAELHERALDAYATAAIFERRARKYRRLVRWLTFVGLLIPVAIGGIALASYKDPRYLDEAVLIGATVGVIMGVFSLWSVVANWPENLDYSSASNADNHRLSDQLKALARQAATPPADFEIRYKELTTLDEVQNVADIRRDISDGEKIYGHRAALLQFKRQCDVCGETPLTMKMPFFPWKRCPRCGGVKKK